MPPRRAALALCLGVVAMGAGFVGLGQQTLPPVLGGGVSFVGGAVAIVLGVRSSEGRIQRLLCGACLLFGVAGLALSALMAGVAPFTSPRSQLLGALTGAVGVVASGILIAGGVLTRRSEVTCATDA